MHYSISSASAAAGVALALGIGVAPVYADSLGEVIGLQGDVLVSSGDSFLPAQIGMQLADQDRVFVLEDSSATLEMAQGCTLDLSSNDAVTLAEESVCAPTGSSSDMLTKAADEAGTVEGVNAIESAALSQDERMVSGTGGLFGGASANAVGLGALGVAAVGGVAWAASNDDPNRSPRRPISPQ